MKLSKQLHWILYPLFFLCCARQTAPTGGPKDTIPPILLKSYPPNGQTKFAGTRVELIFNETLLLNNPKEQILIIPDVGKAFDVQSKKSTLTINFPNPLEAETTYAINFRDAVQDITEKNPTQNLKLAFSTGNYIDSLTIRGTVFEIQTSKPLPDATVALYQSDTFDIFQHTPSYFTKTDKTGTFEIGNLKPGDYYIYAMNDKNKNLITESKSESYGFLPAAIPLRADTNQIRIPTTHLDTRPLKITSARPSGTYFIIKFTKNIILYRITSDNSLPITAAFAETQDNVNIFNTFNNLDSIRIHLLAEDSIHQQIDTTLFVKFSQRTSTPEAFSIKNNGFRILGPKGSLSGSLTFSKPIQTINYDSIFYRIDSLTTIPITPQAIRMDTLHRTLHITQTFDRTLLTPKTSDAKTTNPTKTRPTRDPNQRLQPITKTSTPKRQPNKSHDNHTLYIAANSFISIENDSSKTLASALQPTTLETTGTIIVKVITAQPNIILQLLTKDQQIISTINNQTNHTFEDLDPGNYLLRLIVDQNQDGTWTPGNFYTQTPPEPILYYQNEKKEQIINLKANWELGPLLITYP